MKAILLMEAVVEKRTTKKGATESMPRRQSKEGTTKMRAKTKTTQKKAIAQKFPIEGTTKKLQVGECQAERTPGGSHLVAPHSFDTQDYEPLTAHRVYRPTWNDREGDSLSKTSIG
uniref:Uncharacterized protein n=1 Tax=Nelumbo nucifera TaxID=4432 RepID=A0A822Y3T4_NELNU|nr:TPA_asm: hypothetical protein HUJ06_025752 [Nelumbo nucifera]